MYFWFLLAHCLVALHSNTKVVAIYQNPMSNDIGQENVQYHFFSTLWLKSMICASCSQLVSYDDYLINSFLIFVGNLQNITLAYPRREFEHLFNNIYIICFVCNWVIRRFSQHKVFLDSLDHIQEQLKSVCGQ